MVGISRRRVHDACFNVLKKRCNYYVIYPVRTSKVYSAVFILAGKNNGRLKYGGIDEKSPNLSRHN